ncbi:MAG: DUF2141 domain-containing protein [Akkermansiaceae bacterium]|jgi:uncharacterized protein (DUF2141 family)|tara:strand:- start:4615 stop:5016 length:402 start_codon:yes stop_codon:yes gene_type:complete
MKFFLFLFLFTALIRAEITFEISGVRNEGGRIALLVYEKAEGFPDDSEKALHRLTQDSRKGKIVFKIQELKPGNYAVVVLHDENKNNKIDKNFVGYPKEGFAVSNYSKIARPKFSKAVMKLSKSPVKLKMLYP